MAAKRKTSPQSGLAYWWNEFLFNRPFYYESDLALDDCAHSLESIADPMERGFFSMDKYSREVSVYPQGDGYRFTIEVKRRNKNSTYVSAWAEGSIEYDEAAGRSLISGEARFGAMNYILGFIGIGFLLVIFGFGGIGKIPSPFLLIFIPIMLFTWMQVYGDRNTLLRLIDETVSVSSPYEKGKHRLDDSSAVRDADVAYYDESSEYSGKQK